MLAVTDESFSTDIESHTGLALVDFTGEG